MLSWPASAQEGEPATAITGKALKDPGDDAARELRQQLESSADLRAALAERILRSKIAGAISTDSDEAKRLATVRDWIDSDLDSAAEIAAGLSRDDADGTRRFENTVSRYVISTYERNPNAEKGAIGALTTAAKRSKIIFREEHDGSDEQKRELLRTIFDGKGSQGGTVASSPPKGASGSAEATPSSSLNGSIYDRLSAGNIRGYSPELLAMQNSLNLNRPPGAPRLVETGKLDYATLYFPAYALRHDINILEKRLRNERLSTMAALANVNLSAADWADPALENRLAAKTANRSLPKSLSHRAKTLAKIAELIRSFDETAQRAQDPRGITKPLLLELSARRREAARWIAIAALEEEIAQAERESAVLTPDLLLAIDSVDLPEQTRLDYRRHGMTIETRWGRIKSIFSTIRDQLASGTDNGTTAQIQTQIDAARLERKLLQVETKDYRQIPFALNTLQSPQSRWREWLEEMLLRYAPGTSYARVAAARKKWFADYSNAFTAFAAGNTQTARGLLSTVDRY